MSHKNKAIVLLSGGLDSATCAAIAKETYGAENVVALTIMYGQKHRREIESAKKVAEILGLGKHIITHIPNIFENSECGLVNDKVAIPEISYQELKEEDRLSPVYVPFRNGILLSIAAAYAVMEKANAIYFGAHKGDVNGYVYPDCTPHFCRAMRCAIYYGTDMQVETLKVPLIFYTKADVVREALRRNVPIEHTWSCYNGGEIACGTCPTCVDRIQAFKEVGIPDKIPYKTPIDWDR